LAITTFAAIVHPSLIVTETKACYYFAHPVINPRAIETFRIKSTSFRRMKWTGVVHICSQMFVFGDAHLPPSTLKVTDVLKSSDFNE